MRSARLQGVLVMVVSLLFVRCDSRKPQKAGGKQQLLRQKIVMTGFGPDVWDMAFSPDGKLLAVLHGYTGSLGSYTEVQVRSVERGDLVFKTKAEAAYMGMADCSGRTSAPMRLGHGGSCRRDSRRPVCVLIRTG